MPDFGRRVHHRAGWLAALAVLLAYVLLPASWIDGHRQRLFDVVLQAAAPLRPEVEARRIVIVDITPASLEEIGPWPWRRELLAELFRRALAAKPDVVGVDILLAGEDTRSSAALARQLGRETGRDDLAALAGSLIDGDREITRVIEGQPVALSWLLDPRGKDAPPTIPFLTRGKPVLGPLWRSNGASAPPAMLGAAAAGAGVASLAGDEDGVVRTIPLLVALHGEVYPGLGLETLRLAADASGYLLSAAPMQLQVGQLNLPLAPGGMLRLAPGVRGFAPAIVPATELLRGKTDPALLAGAIVLIGGSAPELGGLRPSAITPLTPTVMIHAHAIHQMLQGVMPRRLPNAPLWEAMAALLFIAAAGLLVARLRPGVAMAGFVALLAALPALMIIAAARDILFDILPALICGTLAFVSMLGRAYATSRRLAQHLRHRFGQHLAPEIVERIVADPAGLKLTGERREVTALFTDIEGFTTLARDTGPEQLLAVLDRYFEGVSAIIIRHGGMIDKFVGDAVHAFFNMPLDLPGHSGKAIACSAEIIAWTEDFRREEACAAIHLGRTRIGIETGEAVVGDVGLATKLDYTAHGSAVNLAARLEALNKETGTAILIGPVAAERSGMALHGLGPRDIRGYGTLEIFTPIMPAGTPK